MNAQEELEARRALKRAIETGDQRAELDARRALKRAPATPKQTVALMREGGLSSAQVPQRSSLPVPLRADLLDNLDDRDVLTDSSGDRAAVKNGQVIPLDRGFDEADAAPALIARATPAPRDPARPDPSRALRAAALGQPTQDYSEDGTYAEDLGRAVASGAARVPELAAVALDLPARGLRAGLRGVGADAAAEHIQPLMETDLYREQIHPVMRDASESWRDGMTAETLDEQQSVSAAMDSAATGEGGIKDFARQAWAGAGAMVENPRALGVTVAESAPDMLTGIGAAGAVGRAAARKAYETTGALMLRAGASPQLAQRIALTAAGKAARVPATAAAAGTEAAQAAGYSMNNVADAIIETPDEDLVATSPRYAKLREVLPEQQAKLIMASDAMDAAGGLAFGTTLAGTLLTGSAAMAGRIGSGAAAREVGQASRGKLVETALGLPKGAAREGAEEFIQEGGQQAAENVAMISSGADTQRDPLKGVAAAAGAGAVAGAAMGGPLGVVDGLQSRAPAARVSTATPSRPAAEARRDSTAEAALSQDDRSREPAGGDDEIGTAFRTIEGKGTNDANLEQADSSNRSGSADDQRGGGAGDSAGGTDGQEEEGQRDAGPAPAQGRDEAVRAVHGTADQPHLPLDQAAHEAATSPRNDLPEPSEAQKEAGNYRKGHVRVQGLEISIENPQGSSRSGTDRDGKPWSIEMRDHYGYVRGTKGRDKEHIDVYLGGDPDAGTAFVVDQVDPATGKFDEHKVMLGYGSEEEARQAYQRNYAADWRGLGAITPMPVADLKEWLRTPQTRPVGKLPRRAPVVEKDPFAPSVAKVPATAAGLAERSRKGLLAEIRRMGGIEQGEMADITGEGRRGKSGGISTRAGGQVRALFTKNGVPLDRVRERMAELGYFGNDGDVTGDLEQVRAIVRAALDGDGAATIPASERDNYEALRIDERIAAEEAAAVHDLSELEAQRAMLQYEANEMLDEDTRAGIAERFDDDEAYYNALREAIDDQRKQTEGDGRGQDDEEAGGRQAGGPQEEQRVEAFALTTQSEEDLAALAQQQADAKAAGEAEARRTAEKAQADRDRDNFALTGSSRPADVAMSGGQRDLLGGASVVQSGTSDAKANQAASAEVNKSETKADIPETPATTSATNADKTAAPLHIEPFGAGGKLIIVRGDTKANKDRIKAIGGALWNKKAEGWTFRADLEPRVRAALADLLEANRDSTAAQAGGTLEAAEVSTDGKPENAPEPVGVPAGDGREDRADGRAGEPDRGSVGGRVAEADQEARNERPSAGRDPRSDQAGTAGQGSRDRERLDGGDRDQADGGATGRPAGIVDEPPGDHVIADGDQVGEGGWMKKVRGNLAAIALAKQLDAEGRSATADERQTLARYVGWGGLKRVFDAQMGPQAHEAQRLRDLLTDSEYAAARASMLDAHYTSLPVVDAIWAAVQRLGFDGGRIVEPAMGTGNFFGRMPSALASHTVLNGVEKDHITGLIARQLYQRADIAINGFEDVSYPASSADLVIGNPPFGSQVLYDSAMPTATRGFSIHNFFFAKAIEITRPGGLVAMVVSHNLMDQADASARRWMADRTHLRGAIRLPYTAFLSNAGTEVVTDILFLQKAMPGEQPDKVWASTREIAVKAKDNSERRFQTSAWFHDHPEMLLGNEEATGKMYGRPDQYNVAPRDDAADLGKALRAAVESLPSDIYVKAERPVDLAATAAALVPEQTKVYGYFVAADGETVMQRTVDTWDGKPQAVPVEFGDKTSPRRAAALIGVRDALRSLMRAEMSAEAKDADLSELRAELNKSYDRFVKQHGFINAPPNRRALRDDPDLPLLESLEPKYDPGVSKDVAKKRDIAARPASAGKADIFKKRVLSPTVEIKTASSAKDALIASLNLKGRIDTGYMAEIYGKDPETIVAELGDLVYRDPEGGVWDIAERYLSGNVKAKLKQAREAAAADHRFDRNVVALEAVQPADVPALKIGVRLGSPWVPGDVIETFARTLLGQAANPVARFLRAIGRWSVEITGGDRAASISRWGTERVPAAEIMAAVMNSKQIIVKDNVGTSQQPVWVVNEPETEAARARADEMAAKFREWIWEDAPRRNRLERIYNDGYNTDRRPTFDGSHLTLPGSRHALSLAQGLKPEDPGALILRDHQINAVWRGIQDSSVLLDHVVGAGKTYTMVATAMESRRLGISRKPMFNVPNHLVRQWRDEFYKLYPNANVLAATEADFERVNRQRLFGKIATGDWDAIIVGHSSFQKIGAPADSAKGILDEQLEEVTDAIAAVKRERGDRFAVRDMERIKQTLEAKLKRLADSAGEKDAVADFGELGVDALFVDEAHLYKNLYYMSQMRGVAGLGTPEGSGRAFDLFVKTRFMEKRYGKQARNISATGTPVSNSLVEMYTMQRYHAYREMQRRGIATLDAWAGLYGDVQNVYEVHPSGTGYRLKTRFAKFVNLPSMMELYRSFADVVSLDDLKAQAKAKGGRFPVPNIKGGKPANVVAERSPQQTEFFGVPVFARDADGSILFKYPADLRPELNGEGKWVLVGSPVRVVKGEQVWTRHAGPFESEVEAKEQAETLIRQPVVGYNKDSILWKFENLKHLNKITNGKINALSVTNEARKAGLDFRLIDPSAPDFEGSKINLAVAAIKRTYDAWSADLGTQLVFCDLSTPQSARASASTKEKPAFVRDRDGALKQVKATVAAIEGQPVPFLVVKEKKGQFVVFDGLTGAELTVRGTTRDAAVSALRTRLASGSHWVDEARERFKEINEDAIAEWKSQQESSDDATGEEDDGITVGDLMAMGGTGSRFSVYDDVKAKLVKAGIPAAEIAFIHDYDTAAKKAALFRDVNAGKIRVLMGSTEKMGAGTNAQERLVGLSHLDAPWRPSDLEQREGRIIRQGNMLYERDPDGFEVEISRYATRQTYDTRMWQLIEHKAAGVEQLRKADASVFEIDDIGGEEANAADMKAAASGNPLILDEIRLRNEVRSLEAQQYAHRQSMVSLQDRLAYAAGARARADAEVAAIQPLIDAASANPEEPFAYASGKKVYGDRKEAAGAVMRAFEEAAGKKKGEVIAGQYRGVGIVFERTVFGVNVSIHAGDGEADVTSYGKSDTFSASGLFTRIDNELKSLPRQVKDALAKAARLEAEMPGLKAESERPFAKSEELSERRSSHRKVVNQLAKAGGGIELTPKMQRELKAALRARGIESETGKADITPAVRTSADSGPLLTAAAARVVAEQALGEAGITGLARSGVLEFVDSAAQLSAAQQDWIETYEAEQTGKRIVAFVDHGIGRAYIISDRVRAADLPGLVMHEVGAHYGLPRMIGAQNYRRLLNEIRLMRRAGTSGTLNAAWQHVAVHYSGLPDTSDEFVGEVLARLSESEGFKQLSVWKRLASMVRQFLFKLGLTRVWNLREDDLGQMVAAALRRTLVPGAVTPTVDGEFARARPGSEIKLGVASESPLYQAIDAGLSKKGGAAMFRSMIAGMARRGEIVQADLDASGLMDWLSSQGASLTRDDLLDHLVATGSGSLSMAARSSDREVPITELEAPEWKGTSHELLELAKAVYTKTLQGETVANGDLGSIAFNAEGKGEAFHPVRHPIDAQVVEALRALVSKAVLLESNPPRKSRENDTVQFHVMVAPLQFNGRTYAVKITVREAIKGPANQTRMKFYDVAVLQKELAPATWDFPAVKPGLIPLPRGPIQSVSLRQLAEAVKPGLGQQFSAAVRGGGPRSHSEAVEEEAWRKAGMPQQNRTLRRRIEDWATEQWDTARESLFEQFQAGMFDRFKPIRDAEGNVDAARSGYLSARMSTGASSVLYGSMLYGSPELRDGVIQKKAGSRGLLQILEPVAADIDRWAAWMVGKRADMLASQHRENNLNLEEIAYLKSLAGEQEARFEAVAKEVRGFMTDILEVMRKSGLLTASQVEEFSKDAYYIPFFRAQEDGGDPTLPFTRRGLSHQASQIKRLKGGVMAINDPIVNLFAHLSRSLDASMKNYALAKTVTNTARNITPAPEGKREKAIRVMWDGKPFWFDVDEPALLRALTAVGEKPRDGLALSIGRSMRSLLTRGVTLDPAFMARNFIRDSMHSWLIDKNAMKFGTDSIRGARAALGSIRAEANGKPEEADPAFVSMLFAGASFIGGHVYGGDPRASAKAMRAALRRKGMSEQATQSYMESLVATPGRFLAMYESIGDGIENANRIAVFKASQAAGDPLAKSLYEAKDLMDFSLRGQWLTVQVMADVLPFFNARLQGLYKLGREARRDPKVIGLIATRIAARGALMALAATALVAAYSGDDRYEELEEWDKDANWHFWVGGVHYRVPKPFELGLVFGTIPERIYRFATTHDRFGELVESMGRGLVNTLAINPVPQALRPISEIYFNFDMFRGRAIESDSDQAKLPEDRFGSHTSPTMVEVGKATGVSPKKLEYAWNGYLGTVGTYFLGAADSLVRVAQGEVTPARRIEDYPILGSFARTGPNWNTEYLTELYELNQEAEQTWKSVRARYDLGDEAGAERLEEDKAELLSMRKMLGAARRRISALRTQRNDVLHDSSLTAEQKRELLDELQIEINSTARDAMRDVEK